MSPRVVVVTGAASGIGRATAARFARGGAKVHACDIDVAGASAVVREIEAAGGRAVAHAVDVADPSRVDALAEEVFATDGAVDVVHNNAGVGITGTFEDVTLEDWRRVLEIDLFGVIHGVRAFAPRMLEQGRRAVIVNTASMAGLVAGPYMGPYVAAKHGVVGLTQSLNIELAPRGVHVCAVCPGFINTPIARVAPRRGDVVDADRAAAMFERFGADPDIVAKAVVRLADRPRVIATVPRWHVQPAWALQRVTPTGYQWGARLVARLGLS